MSTPEGMIEATPYRMGSCKITGPSTMMYPNSIVIKKSGEILSASKKKSILSSQ